MDILLSKIVSSILQLFFFILIPFIWWLFSARKETDFFRWVGLKKIENARENKVAVAEFTLVNRLLSQLMVTHSDRYAPQTRPIVGTICGLIAFGQLFERICVI